MNTLRKEVTYKGNVYDIEYSYIQKDISERTKNYINIFNDNNAIVYSCNWYGEHTDNISIINQTKIAIDEYLKILSKQTFSHYVEFKNWDGNLDKWDE